MATAIVLLCLAGIVALILRSMRKAKKEGKSLQCCMDCSKCNGPCHLGDLEKSNKKE